jgi:hypothetical protein
MNWQSAKLMSHLLLQQQIEDQVSGPSACENTTLQPGGINKLYNNKTVENCNTQKCGTPVEKKHNTIIENC